MNPKQIFGLAGGFFAVYIVITLTNKPHVAPKAAHNADQPSETAQPIQAPGAGAGDVNSQMGFCLPGLGADALASADSDALVGEYANHGRWVAISPALFQANGFADEVAADPAQSPSDKSLAHAIQQAHSAGLQVLLRPVVVSKDGTRRERFVPADPGAWFKSYAAAISPWIDVAEREHVEVLSIGANYAQVEKTQPWDELIKQVRDRYHGKLTYGAGLAEESGNGGYRNVPFWKDLDFVGLEAPLPADVLAASDESAMEDAWRGTGRELGDWVASAQPDRQVLFTSVGFAANAPDAGGAYRSFKKAIAGQPWVAGANWYQYDAQLEVPPMRKAAREQAGSEDDSRPAGAPPLPGENAQPGGAPPAPANLDQ